MTTSCHHYQQGACTIVSRWCKQDVPIDARTCGACERCQFPPRARNRVTAHYALRWLRRNDPDRLARVRHELCSFLDCQNCGKQSPRNATKLLLRSRLCPGDVMTLTAAVFNLHATYPQRWQTAVDTTAMAIWEHNPHVAQLDPADPDVVVIDAHYPSINRSNQTSVNFLGGYTEHLAAQLGVPIRCQTNRPLLYLSREELPWTSQADEITGGRHVPYWIVCAGTKSDFTTQQWPVEYFQEVVDRTSQKWQWVQIGESSHNHPALTGVIDLRGKTDTRQLIRLVYHACGGLGPVTFLQHLCAAFRKPYVCLLGGREPTTWVQYPVQHTLHTLGLLDCCQHQAWWKSRVVVLGDNPQLDESLCELPVLSSSKTIARCMQMTTPEKVIAVMGHVR